MNACTMTQSVRRCLMTSSLLACLWQNSTQFDPPSVIDDSSWSDESLCKDKKGSSKQKTIAWKIAENKGFKLSTICAASVTSPNILHHDPTPTTAYLKGAEEMYGNGILATVFKTLPKAHVRVYKEMNKAAFGRYVCFDKIITQEYEAEELANETAINNLHKIRGDKYYYCYRDSTTPFSLSNTKTFFPNVCYISN